MEERAARAHMRALGIGPVVRNRKWLNAPCPFAPHSRAHRHAVDGKIGFGVSIEEGKRSHFYCFTCRQTGYVWELATELGRLRGEDYSAITRQAFRDDILSIAGYDYEEDEEDQLNDPLDPEVYGGVYDPAWTVPEARNYLQERRITQKAARQIELGWDTEDRRVVFPVRDHLGNLYGYTGRTVLGNDALTNKYPKVKDYFGLPKRHLLLGEDRAREGLPFLVVEGLIGYARLVSIGAEELVNPVAMMGSSLTEQKAERLMRWNQRVYMLPDLDPAGEICLWGQLDKETDEHKGGGAVDKLKDELPLYLPNYPEGVTDVDDLELDDIRDMLSGTPVY